MRTTAPPIAFTRILERSYADCRRALTDALPGVTPVVVHGVTRVEVTVSVGRRWISRRVRMKVPMRLEVGPWTTDGTTTGLELIPLRPVRPTSGYFRAGHRLLDDVTRLLLPSESRRAEPTACEGPARLARVGAREVPV